MSNILQIGYTTEGTTDIRFLENIIRKSFEKIVLECETEIDVYQPEHLRKEGNGFINQINSLVQKYSYFHVICVHCDSDSPNMNNVLQNSIIPAFNSVAKIEGAACKNLVALIPVQMTEAWMMADINLLKEKIGTNMSNDQLGLPVRVNAIEGINNPKNVINESLRIAQQEQSKRRKRLTITQLYSPISQELSIEQLEGLPSYRVFLDNVRDSLRKLNYLHDKLIMDF
jgi:hypothetical protein